MLSSVFHSQIELGIAQALISIVVALSVVWLARQRSIFLGYETLVALVRGLVQVVAVGLILVLALNGPLWLGAILLAGMIAAAASTAARRGRQIPGILPVVLIGIAAGSGSLILIMTILGVIEPTVSSEVTVGSMIIANAMNSVALALDRFRAEVESHVGQIEVALSLGADPANVVEPYIQRSTQAAMIPRIDTLRSLGIVWIPGLMAGMIISGSDPVYAGIYQFVVLALIYASAGLSTVLSLLLVRRRVFSPADQLLLRPRIEAKPGR